MLIYARSFILFHFFTGCLCVNSFYRVTLHWIKTNLATRGSKPAGLIESWSVMGEHHSSLYFCMIWMIIEKNVDFMWNDPCRFHVEWSYRLTCRLLISGISSKITGSRQTGEFERTPCFLPEISSSPVDVFSRSISSIVCILESGWSIFGWFRTPIGFRLNKIYLVETTKLTSHTKSSAISNYLIVTTKTNKW